MSKDAKAVMEKIKKLMRLADLKSGATPAEAATAAAKAQALLLEHNLAVEDLGDLESHMEDEKIKHTVMDLEATYQTSRWHAQLLHRIAKPLFCRMMYHPAKAGKAGKVSLIGKPSNIEVVRYFYSYLYRTIDLMALEYRENWKKLMDEKKKSYIPDESSRVRIDFCLGAVAVVGSRLDEQYKERTEADSTSTALVLVNNSALETAYKVAFPSTKSTSTRRMINGTARVAGEVAGAIIPLHKGVKGSARKQVA